MEKKKRYTKKKLDKQLKRIQKKVFINPEEWAVIEKGMQHLGTNNFSEHARKVLLERNKAILLAKPSDVLQLLSGISAALKEFKNALVDDEQLPPFSQDIRKMEQTLKEEMTKLYQSV